MPPLCPLGPTDPDTSIVSIYTRPSRRIRTRICVLLLRLRCLAQGRCGVAVAGAKPAGNPGSLVMYSDPQLVNTRLMLQSQQGTGGARGIHDRSRRVLRLKCGEGVRDFSASSHEDYNAGCHCMTDKPALTVRREELAFCNNFFFSFFSPNVT